MFENSRSSPSAVGTPRPTFAASRSDGSGTGCFSRPEHQNIFVCGSRPVCLRKTYRAFEQVNIAAGSLRHTRAPFRWSATVLKASRRNVKALAIPSLIETASSRSGGSGTGCFSRPEHQNVFVCGSRPVPKEVSLRSNTLILLRVVFDTPALLFGGARLC